MAFGFETDGAAFRGQAFTTVPVETGLGRVDANEEQASTTRAAAIVERAPGSVHVAAGMPHGVRRGAPAWCADRGAAARFGGAVGLMPYEYETNAAAFRAQAFTTVPVEAGLGRVDVDEKQASTTHAAAIVERTPGSVPCRCRSAGRSAQRGAGMVRGPGRLRRGSGARWV